MHFLYHIRARRCYPCKSHFLPIAFWRQYNSKALAGEISEDGFGPSDFLGERLQKNFFQENYDGLVLGVLDNVSSKPNMVDDALRLPSKITEFDSEASTSVYDNLLYSLRERNVVDDVFVRNHRVYSSHAGNILIYGLCKQRRLYDAIILFYEMRKKDLCLTIITFNILISGLCNSGFVGSAKSCVSLMLKFGISPDQYTCNTLIHGLCTKCLREAWQVFFDMERSGIEPDTVTYNTLLNGSRLLGSIDDVLKVMHKMLLGGLMPDFITRTILICWLSKNECIEEGLKFLRSMAKFQLDEIQACSLGLDHLVYCILIHGWCKLGKTKEVIEIYEVMCSQHIEPDSYAHVTILSYLCRKGMLNKAREFFNRLIGRFQVVAIVLFNIMIDGYVKIGCMLEAVELFEHLNEVGVAPTIVTYNSLLYGLCKFQELIEADKLFQNIKDRGLIPSVITYSILMDAYCRARDMNAIVELSVEMERKGIKHNAFTWTIWIKALCKLGWHVEAENFLNSLCGSGVYMDAVMYNTLIQSFCEIGSIEKAYHLYMLMDKKNLKPTYVTHNLLLKGCMKNGVEEAHSLLERLERKGLHLSKTAYTMVIKAHCVMGNPRKALILFGRMVMLGHEITIKDYSAVINRLCKRHLVKEAKIFLNMMVQSGIVPDRELHNVMANGR